MLSKRNFLIIVLLLGIVAILLVWHFFSKNKISSQKRYVSSHIVTVKSCGETVTFDSVPKRALSFDTNMTEMMLELGLGNHMVGYWISGVKIADKYQDQIKNIPLLSEKTDPPPSLEQILSFNPDFAFGAWGYNFSETSGVTPDKLAQAGVKSYVLSESCTAGGRTSLVAPDPTIDSTYQDILNLGQIFNVENRAQEIVTRMKNNISNIQQKIGKIDTPLRGFYYGGGADTAFTSGKYGMVSKMMSIVGTKNILGDVEKDWIPSEGWETVIKNDPQFIMIDDTPWESAAHRIATLKSLPQLAGITAIKEKRFIVFPWRDILPGVDMDEGIKLLAKAIYPDRFK